MRKICSENRDHFTCWTGRGPSCWCSSCCRRGITFKRTADYRRILLEKINTVGVGSTHAALIVLRLKVASIWHEHPRSKAPQHL